MKNLLSPEILALCFSPTVYSPVFEEELKTNPLGALHTYDVFLKCGTVNSKRVPGKPIQVACYVVSMCRIVMLLISRPLTSYIYDVYSQKVVQNADWND